MKIRAYLERFGLVNRKFQSSDFPLCSDCFGDEGLKLDAFQFGAEKDSVCPNCGLKTGRKLSKDAIANLAHRFFVWGTLHRCDYGAAPVVQFNPQQTTDISTSPWFEADLRLIEKTIGVGFFYYGPRLWMVGEIEPLKALQDAASRTFIIERMVGEYPSRTLSPENLFYRIRQSPLMPAEFGEYDSPPVEFLGSGRLDTTECPILYASQDLQVCIHECRVTAEDELFVATLKPAVDLRLLDLTDLLYEKDTTEFESLDMAVHMLFLAGKHSYEITREIAAAARAAGYDGIIYPSYFSLLRTGTMPFETVYGISHRMIPQLADRERSKTIPNLALFGRPIRDGRVQVKCIDRLVLNRVEYGIHFGPVGYEWTETEQT